jgi:hypothetical protein
MISLFPLARQSNPNCRALFEIYRDVSKCAYKFCAHWLIIATNCQLHKTVSDKGAVSPNYSYHSPETIAELLKACLEEGDCSRKVSPTSAPVAR